MDIQEDLVYRPKSKETQAIYEQMLALVQRHMGDCSLETLKDALDEVLAILKSTQNNQNARKAEIEAIIDKVDE